MTRVLVVDDERDGADGLAMFFGALGYETATACSGIDALEVAEKFRPDVVILDVEMPLMDGFQTARALRGRSVVPGPYLLALTGMVGVDMAASTKACGFDFYMPKPADLPELMRLVQACCPRPDSTIA